MFFLPPASCYWVSTSLPAMDPQKYSSVCSEETSSWHSAFEPTGDKMTSSSTTVGDSKSKARKSSKSKKSGKSKDKKDSKRHKKTSKSKKRRKHSSSKVEPSPISPSNHPERSRSVSPTLGDPMQFHRRLPSLTACAKMLVRARYQCACHFLLLSECPSRGHTDVNTSHSS